MLFLCHWANFTWILRLCSFWSDEHQPTQWWGWTVCYTASRVSCWPTNLESRPEAHLPEDWTTVHRSTRREFSERVLKRMTQKRFGLTCREPTGWPCIWCRYNSAIMCFENHPWHSVNLLNVFFPLTIFLYSHGTGYFCFQNSEKPRVTLKNTRKTRGYVWSYLLTFWYRHLSGGD